LAFGLRTTQARSATKDAERILATIEKEIQRSPNWAKHAMNGALIAIGIFKPTVREKAIEAPKRIGKVEVDVVEMNCKTPEPIACVQKAAKRKHCPLPERTLNAPYRFISVAAPCF